MGKLEFSQKMTQSQVFYSKDSYIFEVVFGIQEVVEEAVEVFEVSVVFQVFEVPKVFEVFCIFEVLWIL